MLRFLSLALMATLAVAGPFHGPEGPSTNDEKVPDLFAMLPELFGEKDGDAFSMEGLQNMMAEREEKEKDCEDKDYDWKFAPPLPCRVENGTYDTLASRKCAGDLQCNIGPLDTALNGTAVRMFFCALPGRYMLYHACRAQNVETGEEMQRPDCPMNGECSVGPIPVTTNGTNIMAYYCDSIKNMDVPEDLMGLAGKACRVENEDGDDKLQRMCPEGYRCTKGPEKVMLQEHEASAWMCEPEPEFEYTLSETVHYLIMEKHVQPLVILTVMHKLQEHNLQITAKRVMELVKKHLENEMEEKKDDKKESVEDVISMLKQLHEMKEKAEEKKEEMKEDVVKHVLEALHGHMEEKKEANDEEKQLMKLLKMLQGKEEEEEDSEEAKLMMLMKQVAFMKKVLEKHDKIVEMDCDEDTKALMIAKAVSEIVKEAMQEMDMEERLMTVKKVMKALMYMKKKEGADEEEDEDVRKMIMILKHLRGKRQEEDDEEGELKKLLAFVKKMNGEEEGDEEEAKLKKLLGLVKMMHGEEEEKEDGDLEKLMKLMKMMKEMKGEKEEDMDMEKLMKLMKVMKEMKGEKEEDMDMEKLMKLMKMMKEMKEGEEEERENPLKEVMEKLKELMEKKDEEEGEGEKILMFLKSMMGEGEEKSLTDIMHYLHHMHLTQKEMEMREKAKEKEGDSKVMEILEALYAQKQQSQMMNQYGMGPMRQVGGW